MNNELTLKEAIDKIKHCAWFGTSIPTECYDVLESTFNKLENLKEHSIVLQTNNDYLLKQNTELIKENSKLEKFLSIIKEKNVDIGYFREDFVKNNYGFSLYEDYPTNYHYGTDMSYSQYKGEFLTKEEFDLVKEMLL